MKKQAIFVSTYRRPRYLHVCLTALVRCVGIADWDVFVDFDGGAVLSPYASYLPHFQVVRHEHLGCRRHPTEVLRTALSFGYERLLYAEEDHLFRSDLLSYMAANASFDGAVCAFHWPDGATEKVRHTADSPNLYSASLASSLVAFMDSGSDLGLPDVCNGGAPISAANDYRDASWWQWAVTRQIKTRFAPEQLCLNFGYCGAHLHMGAFDELAFAGPPERWLDGVLATAQRPEFIDAMATSRDFTYR